MGIAFRCKGEVVECKKDVSAREALVRYLFDFKNEYVKTNLSISKGDAVKFYELTQQLCDLLELEYRDKNGEWHKASEILDSEY